MIDKTEMLIQESVAQLNDSLTKAQKQKLRHQALSLRNAIDPESPQAMAAAEAIMNHVLDNLPLSSEIIVAGYWPIGSELDLRPTLTFLSKTQQVCLPQVLDKEGALLFRQWTPQSSLSLGTWNVLEPQETEPLAPNICLMPLLAFDRQGHRLGYGSGCYDRYLAQRESAGQKVLKVGIAYAEQEVPHIPMAPTDVSLDWIITPSEIIVVHPDVQGATS